MRIVIGLAAALLTVAALPAAAATVTIQPVVDANVSAYSSGDDYPSGTTTIGGINFALASFGGGTGVAQLDGNESKTIAVGQSGVNTAYVILNSAFGTAGASNGSLTFNGSGGQSLVVDLIQGKNIRDHFTAFNNIATDIFATAEYGGGNRFDVYRYDLSALGGTLDNVVFASTNAGSPQGAPFLAGLTTTLESVPAVPEPASWALMISGFGIVGGTMRRRGNAITFA